MSQQLAVRLASGRSVGLGAYVAAWKRCKAFDPALMLRGAPHLDRGEMCSVAEALRAFRAGLHDRINMRGGLDQQRGRKWSPDWQAARRYNARLLNTPRLVIDWLPDELAKRFAHRLRKNMEL